MNANIMNTQIFHLIKYDLKHQRALKVTKGQFYVYFNLNLRSHGQRFFKDIFFDSWVLI